MYNAKGTKKSCVSQNSVSGGSLDTLAQLGTNDKKGSETLFKKAKSKYVSNGLALSLVSYLESFGTEKPSEKLYTKKQLSTNQNFGLFQDEKPVYLKNEAPKTNWLQRYWNTYHCASVLQRNGQKITSRYCGNRWCVTCNRIRTMQLIKGYLPVLEQMETSYFVTLTIPNVSGEKLGESVNGMIDEFRRINDTNKKRVKRGTASDRFHALRKLECTYNPHRKDFHPHFHVIIEGYENAKFLHDEWLKRFPEANAFGQDIREIKNISTAGKEIFKYFTKLVQESPKNPTMSTNTDRPKRAIYVHAMHTIFQAIEGKRIFQPVNIKKEVSEDIEEIQAIQITDQDFSQDELNEIYVHNFDNWYSAYTGEQLTYYKPSRAIDEIEIIT